MKRGFQARATSLTWICVVALGLRLVFLWNYAAHNPKQALGTIPFLFESGNIAYSLSTGHGFSSPFRVDTGPTAWMTPVYPLILAGIFRVFGPYTLASFVAAALVNILATAFTCIPIYYTGQRIEGLRIGAGAAWLWAVFPNAIQIPSTSMWDASIAAFLAAIILWATVALSDSRNRAADLSSWIAYGFLWGLALMTSATLAELLPFLFVWLACRAHRPGALWLARPLLAVAVAALCCVPWTARNYHVFHAFVPLRSILGLQLWLGNNPDAGDIWLGTQHPIHDAAERAKYVEMGEIAYTGRKEREAIYYIKAHRRREAHLIWRRFLAFWSGGTPHPIDDFLRADSAWFRFVLLFNIGAAIGALLGVIALARRRSIYWFPLAVFLVIFPCAYYLTVVLPRYSLPVEPVVMLLTAIATASAVGIARRRSAGADRTGPSKTRSGPDRSGALHTVG